MSGGSLKGSTTVKQSNEPPKWAAPLFEQSAGEAQNLYNSNTGFNIWPGSTVAEPSAMTQAGSQGLADVATAPDSWSLSQNPVQLTNQMMSQGGLMSPSQTAMSFFGDVAGGGYNPSTSGFDYMFRQAAPNNMAPGINWGLGQYAQGAGDIGVKPFWDVNRGSQQFGGEANAMYDPFRTGETAIGTGTDFRDIYGRAQAPGAAEDYLTSTARGDYLAEGNPYFRELLTKEAERLGDQVTGMFSGAGRYGSGAHQGVLGETVGDFTLKGLSDDFTRERGLQMTAAQAIEAAQQGRLGQQLDAMVGQTGVEGQNIANQLRAADSQSDLGQFLLSLQRGLAGDVTGLQSQNVSRQLDTTLAQRGFAGEDWQRQMDAMLSGFGANQENLQNQMGAAGDAAGISSLGLQQALGYINALPTIQQNRTFAPQLQMQAGAVQDQYNQQLVNDMISRFYQQDMQPWTQLGALQAAAQGAAGQYGMAQQMTQQNPGLLNMLGSGLSLAGGFF
jgi:hypothetical protein